MRENDRKLHTFNAAEYINFGNKLYSDYVFDSLDDLIKFIDQYNIEGYWFRGQSQCWPVCSTLYRYKEEQFKSASHQVQTIGTWLLKNKIISDCIQGNEDNVFAIAQHYGCPTDLIDITSSLDVAAYFASIDNEIIDEALQNDDFTQLGCIWCFNEEEIRSYFDIRLKGQFSKDNEIYKDLEKRSFNLLTIPKIPKLSRLNAQKGAFLWDLGGMVSQMLNRGEFGIRFVFRHTKGEKSRLRVSDVDIYPEPNSLEIEITRVLSRKKCIDDISTSNGIPLFDGISSWTTKATNYLDNIIQTIDLDSPNLFEPSLGEYDWKNRKLEEFEEMPNYSKNIQEKRLYLYYSKKNADSIVSRSHDIISFIVDNNYSDLAMKIKKGELSYSEAKNLYAQYYGSDVICLQLMENNIHSKIFFPVKQRILSITVRDEFLVFLKNILHICNNPNILYECSDIYIPTLYKKIYNHFMSTSIEMAKLYVKLLNIKLPLSEMQELYFMRQCIEKTCKYFSYFAKDNNDVTVFLFQNNPRKLLSYEVITDMFLKFALPQQILFYGNNSTIFIPDYLDTLGFA